jgi:hypothetical protein
LPEDLEGDALAQLHGQGGIGQHLQVRMAVGVDEARSHHVAGAVDGLAPFEAGAHRGDRPVLDRDVGGEGRRTRSVDDPAAGQDERVHVMGGADWPSAFSSWVLARSATYYLFQNKFER